MELLIIAIVWGGRGPGGRPCAEPTPGAGTSTSRIGPSEHRRIAPRRTGPMERLIFRSTSISHLEAELRHQELLAAARGRRTVRPARRPRAGFRLSLPGLGLFGRTRD